MTIRISTPPDKSLVALKQGLQLMLGARSTEPPEHLLISDMQYRLPAGSAQSEIQAGAPHPVFIMHLDDILAAKGITAVRQVAWRYFLGTNDKVQFAAEVNVRENGEHAFAGINEGPFNQPMWMTLANLQQRPEIAAHDFELRLLRIPALYVTAIWLHAESSNDDLFIPMARTPTSLNAGQIYKGTSLLETLQPDAEICAAFNNDDEQEP